MKYVRVVLPFGSEATHPNIFLCFPSHRVPPIERLNKVVLIESSYDTRLNDRIYTCVPKAS